MSNLKKIGNKLFKETTELKSQEVKLGAIDDLRDEYQRIASKAVPLKRIIQNASNDLSRVSDNLNSVQSKAKKLEEIAKELGATEIVKAAQALSSAAKGLSSSWGKSSSKISSAAKEI